MFPQTVFTSPAVFFGFKVLAENLDLCERRAVDVVAADAAFAFLSAYRILTSAYNRAFLSATSLDVETEIARCLLATKILATVASSKASSEAFPTAMLAAYLATFDLSSSSRRIADVVFVASCFSLLRVSERFFVHARPSKVPKSLTDVFAAINSFLALAECVCFVATCFAWTWKSSELHGDVAFALFASPFVYGKFFSPVDARFFPFDRSPVAYVPEELPPPPPPPPPPRRLLIHEGGLAIEDVARIMDEFQKALSEHHGAVASPRLVEDDTPGLEPDDEDESTIPPPPPPSTRENRPPPQEKKRRKRRGGGARGGDDRNQYAQTKYAENAATTTDVTAERAKTS